MFVRPKIMQLDLWSEMFSAKYCSSGPIKDVRAQKFPRTDFFLNLPRRKVMIYICQKGKKKMRGHRFRFGNNVPRKIP